MLAGGCSCQHWSSGRGERLAAPPAPGSCAPLVVTQEMVDAVLGPPRFGHGSELEARAPGGGRIWIWVVI